MHTSTFSPVCGVALTCETLLSSADNHEMASSQTINLIIYCMYRDIYIYIEREREGEGEERERGERERREEREREREREREWRYVYI